MGAFGGVMGFTGSLFPSLIFYCYKTSTLGKLDQIKCKPLKCNLPLGFFPGYAPEYNCRNIPVNY